MNLRGRYFTCIEVGSDKKSVRKSLNGMATVDQLAGFRDEISYYVNLPDRIAAFFPRVLEFDLGERPFIAMEYLEGTTLSHMYVCDEIEERVFSAAFQAYRNALAQLHDVITDRSYSVSDCDMFVPKTRLRLSQSDWQVALPPSHAKIVRRLFNEGGIVNEIEVGPVFEILDFVGKIIPTLIDNKERWGVIHGDPVFSNVIIGDDLSVCFVDPRGRFGGEATCFGNKNYDLAKMAQSLFLDYDLLLHGMANISHVPSGLCFNLVESEVYREKRRVASDVEMSIKCEDATLLAAVLMLGAIPLHKESHSRQMAMLGKSLHAIYNIADQRNMNTIGSAK